MSLQVGHDAIVDDMAGSQKPIKRNQTLMVPQKPHIVKAAGRVSLLVFPTNPSDQSNVSITLPEFRDWSGPQYAQYIRAEVAIVLNEVMLVQDLMIENRIEEALARLTVLEKQYPIEALRILQGSCYVLLNQNEKAIGLFKQILQTSPDNEVIKKALAQLANGDSP